MLHTVEVRHIGTDLANAAAELKLWLDNHRIQPAAFEHSVGGPGITFRVHFTLKDEALAFAEMFHGWLNDGVQSNGTARWAISPRPKHPLKESG